MIVEVVARRQESVPFRPYSLRLADSRELTVEHPDFASVSIDEESITIFDDEGGVEVVDLALAVSITYGGNR
jgi:hypothetical protein